jgi:hypothetical protein
MQQSRFPADLAENASVFNGVQSQFNQAINHAKSGTFPSIIDPRGTLRGYFRTVLHFRHTSEKALKALHDAYLNYKRAIPDLADDNDQRLSMHSFFSSPARIAFAKANVEIRQGEEQIFAVLQQHLMPAI